MLWSVSGYMDGRTWVSGWGRDAPAAWWKLEVKPHATGKFTSLRHVLQEKASKSAFEKTWLPSLLDWFCEPVEGHQYRLKGSELSLQIGGRVDLLQSVPAQAPATLSQVFRRAAIAGKGQAIPIDPDTDPVFSARKELLSREHRRRAGDSRQSPLWH